MEDSPLNELAYSFSGDTAWSHLIYLRGEQTLQAFCLARQTVYHPYKTHIHTG